MLQPSTKLLEAACEDAMRVFDAHVDKLPLEKIYASDEFGRIKKLFLREFPKGTNKQILTVVLQQYGERLKKV